ncbi:methionine sulfoxide reductase A [Salpingoeca rosetta]|uniref:peptide-methionine (S)-S-oxide reductase n=1 Tax=Salpingoeca rosetta (strain ATCC 50818 / BSB-021) TaxID=946362 RepID=F2TW06_SALR5|nr:methionine sulfoxide reductase A [Salpingoeca rosetta]EGD72252.1 methionine sulfoxide reductase A [Salpingoeca rosetta]|eukprot:XP_004998823.1 methionine sulfoxide reductase A [Salpingoeca rosetta]
MPGVLRTRVGYTGGHKSNPTYYSLGDHTEAVQIEFDPKVVTFEQLLDKFWVQHDASRKSSRQYQSALWYQTEDQKQAILKAIEAEEKKARYRGRKIATHVAPLGPFYLAEDYHQKYLDRSLLGPSTEHGNSL